MEIEDLIKQVQSMAVESGNDGEFDARAWFMRWVHTYVPALRGYPGEYMHSPEGRQQLSRLLTMMSTGNYD